MERVNKLLVLVSMLGCCVTILAQVPQVSIHAKIDRDLALNASLNFKLNEVVDTLKIYKYAAGKNKNGAPNIRVKSISNQNVKVSFIEDDNWIVIPNQSRLKELTIQYQLHLKDVFDWRRSYEYSLFPATYHNMCWYPDMYINNERNFYKDFTLTIEHPEELTLLTSADLMHAKHNGTTKVSMFKSKRMRYCALNAGYNFVNKSIVRPDFSLSYFCPPEKENEYLKVAETALEAVDWYKKKYGFFPIKRLAIAMGHPKWRGGFPSENLFYIHQGNLEEKFVQWIASHELGHYYWGLHTLSATEDELSPLMLANGIWIDHLYLSEAYQKSFIELWNLYAPQAAMIEKYLATYLANMEQKIGYLKKEQNFGFDYNSNIAHGKAAVGLYLLANRIGVDRYVELQKELLNHYKEKPLSVASFIHFLEARGYSYAGRFIEQWYQDNAIIEYVLTNVKLNKHDKNWEYSFQIRKIGSVDYPIEIEVSDVDGNRYTHTTEAVSKREMIKGTSKSKPDLFKLDANGKVPMWNSDNTDIQRLFILSLYRSGRTKIAKQLAQIHLRKNPADKRLKELLTN